FDNWFSNDIPSYRLVASTVRAQTTDQILVPYNTAADSTNAGWFFTTDLSFSTHSAEPTRFVKVLGPEDAVNPTMFYWDGAGLERSVDQKENLRGMIDVWFSAFDDVHRHYADYAGLSEPPPLIPLARSTIRAAIDDGQHFLSLTGHGTWGGCCEINVDSNANFTNSLQYFIAFADSCQTARPDAHDSFAEVSLLHLDG